MLLHMIEVLRINDSNFDFPHLLLQSKNYPKPLQPNKGANFKRSWCKANVEEIMINQICEFQPSKTEIELLIVTICAHKTKGSRWHTTWPFGCRVPLHNNSSLPGRVTIECRGTHWLCKPFLSVRDGRGHCETLIGSCFQCGNRPMSVEGHRFSEF